MLQPHDQIGRYEIRRRVAQGGMGTLYLAHDATLDRLVALKLFQSGVDDPEARDRFAREARAAAALSHPNIVTIYDFGDYTSHPYIVMEFIQGETLADVIHRKALVGVATKLKWMEQLCSAVGYAHAGGIIHRDVKPPNLMIDPHGRLKVLDFGIARMRGSLASNATAKVGTPGYMAPEQLRGGAVDHRSDLFSIGAVCYEVFANVEAFGAGNEHLATHQILHEEPTPLAEVCPGIDPGLAAIVAKALRKDPDERFQDAETLLQALAAVRGRIETLEPDTIISRYVPPPSGPGAGPTPRHTPPVDKARADREAIVKKRTAQIRLAVDLAAAYLHQGDLTGAREQCNAVFALDRAHPEALALMRAIGEAANDATVVIPRPAAGAELPVDEDETVIGKSAATARAAADTEAETVLRSIPSSSPPLASAETRGGPADGATILVRPDARPSPSPVTVSLPDVPSTSGTQTKAQHPRPPASVHGTRIRSRQGKQLMLVAAGASLLIAIVAAVLLIPKSPPPAATTPLAVVIDAVPWGTVSRIEGDQGAVEALPASSETPLLVKLRPGRYRVSLVGPPPQLEARVIDIDVSATAPAFVMERFTPMTVDGYFDANLASLPPPAIEAPAAGSTGQ